MPRFHQAEQGSDDWHAVRAGHATASRFKDIIAGQGQRERYKWELVGERLASAAKRNHSSKTLEWGHTNEPLARDEYKIRTGNLVELAGFATHSRIMWLGASTDGLVGKRGAAEIKSPFNCGIHAETLCKGMPEMHVWQTQGNLLVLDRDWIDFCSFEPDFPAPYNLYIQHVERDEKLIKKLTIDIKDFLADVAVAVRDIQASTFTYTH